ncbi:MAG: ABC transporter substrate-binding protein [Candidatus Bathyarchaeia archaeon]
MKGKVRVLAAVLLTLLFMGMLLWEIPISYAQVPKGPWVDEVIFSVETDEAKTVDMLLKNEIQVYFRDIRDPKLFEKIKASPDLWYVTSYGLYFELTFNPVGPEFPATGKLNPFSVPRIREAMNYLVDRKYICDEIMAGMAVPRYTALTPAFPDYARYADVIKGIEKEYSYNFDKAREIITEEMIKLGAELKEGKWYYKGEPVIIIFIIRVEDQRRMIGDYVASQLEKIGFTVDRQYKTSREAAPIWIRGNPADGKWHLYTGGWITTLVSRDEADNFGFFYTPRAGLGPLWSAYKPSPEFDYVAGRLWTRDYKTIEERDELMRKALKLSMEDSVRVWLVSQTAPWPARKEVSLTYDLAAGFSGARLWPYTIRYVDKVGGTVKIVSTDLLVDPINPVGGSNWVYDAMFYRALSDPAVMPDPFTGLYWPQRVKRAEVYVEKGLPVGVTLDWVSLKFVDEITVPRDAWYDWDPVKQEIIYAPPGTKAKTKTVVYYDDNLFNIKFHDGSKLSLADIVFAYILTFDRAKPESPVYDESYIPAFEAFREYFRGFKIVSTSPLVIEYYSDQLYLDAEWIAWAAASAFYPEYSYGPAPWHMVAIGWLAEADKKLAFSADKAENLKVEWMSYVAGPSIPILAECLEKAIKERFIPYRNVLGKYVSEAEALERYSNLKKWYDAKGHFLIGNGPFYLDRVDPTARIVVLKANREFIDPADKWLRFSKPMVPEVKITAAPTIVPGLPANITISVTFEGKPYSKADMSYIKYIITSPTVTLTGAAEAVEDGKWVIRLKPEETALLVAGAVSIDVVAVSKLVGMPVSVSGTAMVMSETEYMLSELAKAKADYEVKISDLKTSLERRVSEINTKVNELAGALGAITTAMWVGIAALVISIIAIILTVLRRK